MSRIVGIDLGTSTSEISIMTDGKPFVIKNNWGDEITPSVVGMTEDGRFIVGREAREQMLLRPQDTVIEVKRLMGTNTQLFMGGRAYTPPEISAFILRYLVDCAALYLGEKPDRAVITVPAYFSDEQRRATVEAGKMAGLKVERILNEPTAAALDYGIDHMADCKNILVYDLGGGTLDVTVLELFEGILDVKASSGNNKLGGKDFDAAIIDYLLEEFTRQYGLDMTDNLRAMMRVKEAAEKCKIQLSTEQEYSIILPFFADAGGSPVALESVITRSLFESLISTLIESTKEPIFSALKDANLEVKDIEMVLLVGGSTRIPFVRQFIQRIMGSEPQTLIDPDLAVARGAAVQAAILNDELSQETDILITDVCPYTLGISILGEVGGIPIADVFDSIIPRNTTIPVIKEKIYGTVQDNQKSVEIKVFQGDYKRASLNNALGCFTLEGIPPALAFKEKVKVAFSYDTNGILNVSATIVSTGANADISVETTGAGIDLENDLEKWKDMPAARKYRPLINKAQKIIDHGATGGYELEIDACIKNIKKGLVRGQRADELEEIRAELQEILYNLEDVSDG